MVTHLTMKTYMHMGRVVFVAILPLLFAGCGGCSKAPESSLGYLWAKKGEHPVQSGVIDSKPLNDRLKALLQSRYDQFVENWDLGGPLDPKEHTLFATGCVSHFCDEYGSAFHIDLEKDELIAMIRAKYKVELFREKEGGLEDLPAEVTEWIGTDELSLGDPGTPIEKAASTGAFDWKAWDEAPADWKEGLKRLKANKKMSVFQQAEQAAGMPCDVRIARYDLDGDGEPGTLLTYSCSMWCGQVGCAFKVYEGGKRIDLVDNIQQVMPGKGGVVSSKGKFIKLK